MDLQRILDEIDTYCPNTFTQAEKINYVNDIQRKVFREMAIQDIVTWNTIKGVPIYDLYNPADNQPIEFDMIRGVTIDNINYQYADIWAEAKGYIYYNPLPGKIGLFPTPGTDDLIAYVFYEKRPKILTASDLLVEPELRADWHEILIHGVVAIIANMQDDLIKSNNARLEYNTMMSDIMQQKYEKGGYPVTKNVQRKQRFFPGV